MRCNFLLLQGQKQRCLLFRYVVYFFSECLLLQSLNGTIFLCFQRPSFTESWLSAGHDGGTVHFESAHHSI